MSGEVDDLMLSLFQIADDRPAVEPVSKDYSSVLQDIKPYPFHKGCGGMIAIEEGFDEEDNEAVSSFTCTKCGYAETVNVPIPEDGKVIMKLPVWVSPPNMKTPS